MMSDTAAQKLNTTKRFAPPGAIWVCGACGKTSDNDSYGIIGKHDRGWDESCALNAVLCRNDGSLKRDGRGRVINAEPFRPAKEPTP